MICSLFFNTCFLFSFWVFCVCLWDGGGFSCVLPEDLENELPDLYKWDSVFHTESLNTVKEHRGKC